RPRLGVERRLRPVGLGAVGDARSVPAGLRRAPGAPAGRRCRGWPGETGRGDAPAPPLTPGRAGRAAFPAPMSLAPPPVRDYSGLRTSREGNMNSPTRNRQFDKSKLPSRHVTEGPARAPHRSYLYAMGISEAEIHQPLVGVATCWHEAAPCHIALNRQAQSVKMGVKKGGGTPREFTTITVTDGIAMGHEGMRSSLASRDAIADTVELTMRGHCYDALVGL